MTASELAQVLKVNGFDVLDFEEEDEFTDGAVYLGPDGKVHVQVSNDFLNVVEEHVNDEFTFHDLRTNWQEIVADLNKVLKKEKP